MHYPTPSVSDAWHLAYCQCLAELIGDLDAIALDAPLAAAPVRSMIDALNGRILVHARQVAGDATTLPDVLQLLTRTGCLNLTMAPDGSLASLPVASNEAPLRAVVLEPLRAPAEPFFPRQPFEVADIGALPPGRVLRPIRDQHHAAVVFARDVLASVCADVHEHILGQQPAAAVAAARFHVSFLRQSSLRLEQALADDDFLDWHRKVSTPDSFDEIPQCLTDSCASTYAFRVLTIGMVTACYALLVEQACEARGAATCAAVQHVVAVLDQALAAFEREVHELTTMMLGMNARADFTIATAPRPPGPPVVIFAPSRTRRGPSTN